jgi:hypothetical protein
MKSHIHPLIAIATLLTSIRRESTKPGLAFANSLEWTRRVANSNDQQFASVRRIIDGAVLILSRPPRY